MTFALPLPSQAHLPLLQPIEGRYPRAHPLMCQCGGYLSEDLDGRCFCRHCRLRDPRDLTILLPLAWRHSGR